MEKIDFVFKILSIVNMPLSPIQIQKLFFLLEKRLGKEFTYFEFKPYFYGPYDKELTELIKEETKNNKIDVSIINGVDYYQVNWKFLQNENNFIEENNKNFIIKVANFIKQKTFKELCFAIYKEFPEMQVNSVFNGK